MEIDYVNLLGLTLIAVGAPVLIDALRLPVPDAVAMILLGIAVGGSGLGWIELDGAVELLSALGLAYLLFVAGLEIRVEMLRGRMLALGLASFALSCAIAVGLGVALQASGLVEGAGVVVAALLTTSIGIVVVVLKDAGRLQTPVGQLSLLGALLGDVASVALLSVLFVDPGATMTGQLWGLALFAVVAAVLAVVVLVASTLAPLRAAVAHRLGGATQIAVRLSFAVMVGFAALAQAFGPEAILGAFLAGVAVSAVSDRNAGSGATRDKLEVVGFGLLAPMFFVAAGVRFDAGALADASPVLVPVLLAAMLVTRAVPGLLFWRVLAPREIAASALLMSTKLTFVVAAVQIGLARGGLPPATASALIAAAVITVVTLPALASWVLRQDAPAVTRA
ncbi:MAG: cation:proton antiporter [Pseudonocardia sp.]